MMKEDWFETWFDSNYYHLLYQHRNDSEAKVFLNNLIKQIPIAANSLIIDVGCGKGRHAKYLNSQGFNVQGIDLSPQSIITANKAHNQNLNFAIHDMRLPYKLNHYDVVLNLFTSFGYFNDDEDNINALMAMYSNLKSGGTLILDYFNPSKVKNELSLPIEEKNTIDEVEFSTKKYISNNFVIKEIDVQHKDEIHHYIERVQLIPLNSFKSYLKQAGFNIECVFGDYRLNEYNENISERMIIIAKK